MMAMFERITPISAALVLWLTMQIPPDYAANVVATNRVDISYAFTQSEFSLREPVELDFTIRNNFGGQVRLDLGRNYKENFLFAVTSPDGVRAELPSLRFQGAAQIGLVSLGVGEEFRMTLLLNEWTEFKSPGLYKIQVRLAKPVETEQGIAIPAGAQRAEFNGTVEITPDDPARLASVCAALVHRVEESSSFEEASNAALALSYVDDPIAVPYLRQILFSKRGVEFTTIDGLERIADPSAVQSLILALSLTSDPWTPVKARTALGRIKATTKDPAEQEIIRQALER